MRGLEIRGHFSGYTKKSNWETTWLTQMRGTFLLKIAQKLDLAELSGWGVETGFL